MAVVVVGGGGRGVGKTALVCGVIAALPEREWIAVKIARHEHGVERPVWEETGPGERTDTARFLTAGAQRAFLLTAADEAAMQCTLDELWQLVERRGDLIFESNRVLRFLKPDVCLMVAGEADAKTSFTAAIRCADAIVTGSTSEESPEPSGSIATETRPVFHLEQFERLSPEMTDWIRGRLIYG
jgi:hypothetical protein